MKVLIFFCLFLMALSLRNTHKSQYDLGYEAGVATALQEKYESMSAVEAKGFWSSLFFLGSALKRNGY